LGGAQQHEAEAQSFNHCDVLTVQAPMGSTLPKGGMDVTRMNRRLRVAERRNLPSDAQGFKRHLLELVLAVETGKGDAELIDILESGVEMLKSRADLARKNQGRRVV
jgi:hypothetical protein